jgi:hypothetical protein
MKSPSRPLPVWLKWLMRVVAPVLMAYGGFSIFVVSVGLLAAANTKEGLMARLMARSGMPLLETVGRLGLGAVLVYFGIWLLRRSWKKPAQAESSAAAPTAAPAPATVARAKVRKVNYSSCNIFRASGEPRQLWEFQSRKSGFVLDHEHALRDGQSLPGGSVNKSWSSLWQPKLNVAWLPPESVFLRVVQLPKSSQEETISMIELQLEKLSPIPLTQVIWSIQPLAQAPDGLQTLIVVLAERKAVEEFLGRLEDHGFLADRLELPVLDQLLATPINEDGAWVYPGLWGRPNTALVAWWYGGALQNITFISRSGNEQGGGLGEQLDQTIWAGELEGWLTSPPKWHLVADGAAAAEWESPLREELAEPLAVTDPLVPAELAALTANRAARPENKTNLLPPEFSKRYQQQFVDRLWLHGLFAAGAVYIAAVLIYFALVGVVAFQTNAAEKQARDRSGAYTNAIQAKARYEVLKERQELKFAALDCWRAVAESLPETLSLDGFNFNDGKKLTLNGTAPKDDVLRVSDFYSSLRKTTISGKPLFNVTAGQPPSTRLNPGAAVVNWNFTLELERVIGP